MRYLGGGGGITVQIYFAFESTVGLWTLYIQELRYTSTFCECILKKTDLCTHISSTTQGNRSQLMSLKSVFL